MPHVRERQPLPEEPSSPGTGDGATPTAGTDAAVTPAGGRVDDGAATTGTPAGSEGEAAPGGIPGDDGSLEGGSPA